MPTMTRANNLKKGNAIVHRAIRHGLVPDFIHGATFREQTFKTKWAIHVLAVMSEYEKPNINDVKFVIELTQDLVEQ